MIWPKGSETILADNFDGKPFEGPNDLVVDKKDGVYFTLSGIGYGALRPAGCEGDQGVLRIQLNGSTALP